ncbi:MAG: TetR/AcrR family transcriptional regulator [Chloroflexota bacterium]
MSSDSRSRILHEAEQLFGQQGFAGTRLSSIASAVGLGNAGLLHHFPSKAALYRAVLDKIAADFDSQGLVDDQAEDSVAKLKKLVDGLLSMHRERPNAMAVIVHEFLDRSGRIDKAEVLPLAGIVADTAAILRAGQQAGTIRSGDPVAMTAALHGSIMIGCLGRMVYSRTSGEQVADNWEEELMRSALASVLTPQ